MGGGALAGIDDCGICTEMNPELSVRIFVVGTTAMKPGKPPLDGTETMLSGSPMETIEDSGKTYVTVPVQETGSTGSG